MSGEIRGIVALTLRSKKRRIIGLCLFGLLFLVLAVVMRFVAAGPEGHIEADRLFAVGGYPLVSTMLLMGWVLGRFPLIAILALMAGLFSHDRAEGYARLYYSRPVSPVRVYAARFLSLAAVAFAISAVLMPLFDLIMLGSWAGPATLVLILTYILVYGGLVAFLSIWTRGDVWITLALALVSIAWEALRRAGALAIPAGSRQFVTVLLPPQAAIYQLESAFGALAPIPWDAFLFAAGYGLILLILAGISLTWREV